MLPIQCYEGDGVPRSLGRLWVLRWVAMGEVGEFVKCIVGDSAIHYTSDTAEAMAFPSADAAYAFVRDNWENGVESDPTAFYRAESL